MIIVPNIPLDVHPSVRPGLHALGWYLTMCDYNAHSIEGILAHVANEGTLAGLVDRGLLEASDEAAAEHVYVKGLEPVSQCDAAWEDSGCWATRPTGLDAVETMRRWYAGNPSFAEWLERGGGEA